VYTITPFLICPPLKLQYDPAVLCLRMCYRPLYSGVSHSSITQAFGRDQMRRTIRPKATLGRSSPLEGAAVQQSPIIHDIDEDTAWLRSYAGNSKIVSPPPVARILGLKATTWRSCNGVLIRLRRRLLDRVKDDSLWVCWANVTIAS
jgi:hypothetical protein